MKEQEELVSNNQTSKKFKVSISTLVLIVASSVMLGTLLFLAQKPKPAGSQPSRQPLASQIQSISEKTDVTQNQTIPMQADNLDFDESLEQIGLVKVEKVSLSLPIVKGRGKEDGTDFDKAIYACTNKKNQILGVTNYVLSAHSDYQSATRYFSPLLLFEDGSFDLTRETQLADLKLKVGDIIEIEDNQDKMRYTFKISTLFIDDGQGNFLKTYQAMSDVVGQPQVTLYTCVDVAGDRRLVVQGDYVSKTSLSS